MDAAVAPAPVAVVPLERSALAGALLLRPDECHREEALQERRACHCLREQGAPRRAAGAVLADRSGSVFRVWEQHAACQNAARERARHSKIHLRAAGCDRSGRQSAARIRRIPSCLLRTHLGVSIGTQTDRIRSTRLGMSMSVRRTSSAGTHRNGSFGTCRRPCAHTARPPAASARPRPSPATCPVCEGTGPERVQRDREKVKWRGGVEGRSTREPARNGAQRRWWEHQFAAERAVPLWLGRGHEKVSACLKLTRSLIIASRNFTLQPCFRIGKQIHQRSR